MIDPLTKRQIFDKVKIHLLAQGYKSEIKYDWTRSMCAYRGPNGSKCAVGVLIDDEHYHEDLENQGCHSKDVRKALEKSNIIVTDDIEEMLLALQALHDTTEMKCWGLKLRELEDRFF